VMAVGDGSNYQKGALSSAEVSVRSYLPRQSADITVLFGVGPGVDYANFIDGYINPANAAAHGVTAPYVVTGANGQTLDLSTATGWAMFQRQSTARQHLIADRFFLDFLAGVAKDYNNPNSPFAGQYARAYQAISTLFPASLGYTNNASAGAATPILTGRFNLVNSVLETQMGGDINLIGPGGDITVGTSSAQLPTGSTTALRPNQQGILTLAGGTIRAFTDRSIQVNQSRIMTEQGGDIDLFSANGDIGAGSGPKTYISSPVFSPICDQSGFCRVNPSGLVTGAGIAALVTLPGQDPANSNVNLAAPHGKIDFGSAGVRVGGNLNLVALQVVNAYNVQVGGVSVGVPTAPAFNTALSTPANNPTPAKATQPTSGESASQTSIIIVEILGFGGSTDAPADNSNVNRGGGADARKRDGNDKCTSEQDCQP